MLRTTHSKSNNLFLPYPINIINKYNLFFSTIAKNFVKKDHNPLTINVDREKQQQEAQVRHDIQRRSNTYGVLCKWEACEHETDYDIFPQKKMGIVVDFKNST